jgi:hypothetical protein
VKRACKLGQQHDTAFNPVTVELRSYGGKPIWAILARKQRVEPSSRARQAAIHPGF